MAEVTQSEKNRQFRIVLMIFIALGCCILIASFYFFGGGETPKPSSVSQAKSNRVSGAAGGAGSDAYNDKVKEKDESEANDALQEGSSFVPTPIGEKKPLVSKTDTPPPAAQPVRPPVAAQYTSPVKRGEDPRIKIMLNDLKILDDKLIASRGQGKISFCVDPEKNPDDDQITPATNLADSPAVDMRPGDLLYAAIDTGVNSDVPSAVMATVAGGKFAKTRLLGQFKRFEERLVLQFNRAILPDGLALRLDSYAIDPDTTEASVASNVDTHLFSRWGGLIASAFLEGLGEAKRFSGASSLTNNLDATEEMAWSDYSVQDQAWIAAGKVGEKTSKIFERNFDRPPTVYLKAGTPVGILVLDVASESQNNNGNK